MDNLIGQTLGNYQIEALIGTGGMGQVFRAVHRHLGRPAAIKVLHANLAAEQGFQARFLQEARAVASLKHPNIVEVYDFGEQAGRFYLVMELIDGGSLRQLLSQIMAQAGLPLWTGLDLVRQTADGLALAHARQMVHRDIKPDNLLLSNIVDGNQLVKITDFGLVRLAESGAMTAVGSVLGTAAYLSPEQCQGLELDGRSDIYSLGVVLYEVATGYVPFQANTLSAAVYHHVQVAPPPPRTIRPDLPLELEKIIMRCLAKRPEERYSSAAELSGALRTVVIGANQATVIPPHVRAPEPAADNPAFTVVQQQSRREAQFPPPSLGLDSALTTAPGAPCIRLHDQTGKVLQRVELTPDGITIGRAPDNNLCYESADLSRNHLRINLEGQRVTVTDLGSSNGTYLEGIRLLPQVAQVWEGSEPLRLGSLWLALEPASAPSQSVAVGSSSRSSRSNQIGVALDSKAMALIPGQPAKCKVSLVNLEEIVDHISLEVVGVPAQWVEGTASEVQLNPGTQATVLLTIVVPRESASRAGDYQVTIRVRSRENPGEPGTAEATWTVLPFAAMSVRTTPAKAGGRREAAYNVTLRNEGNAPARYVLSAQDDEEMLAFLFEASSSKSPSRITVDLEPDAASIIKLRVGAGRRWFGKAEAHSFSVQVVPENKKDAQVSAARFMHQPLIPTWVMVVAPVVVIGLGLLASVIAGITPDLVVFAPLIIVLELLVVGFVLLIRLPDITRGDYRRAWAINPQPGDAFQKQGTPTLDSGRFNAAPLAPAVSTGEPAAPAAGPPFVGQDFYSRLLSDPTPGARQAVQLIESLRMTVRPRLSAYLGRIIFLLLAPLAQPIGAVVFEQIGFEGNDVDLWSVTLAYIFVTFAGLWLISLRMGVRPTLPYFGRFLILLLALIIGFVIFVIPESDVEDVIGPLTLIVPSLCLILLIIRVKTTLITVDQGRLEIATGVLSKNISNIELHRIVDLSLHRTILNRLTGDGSLILSVEQWRKPPQQVVLRGLAKRDRLDTVYSNLRNLVQILRSRK